MLDFISGVLVSVLRAGINWGTAHRPNSRRCVYWFLMWTGTRSKFGFPRWHMWESIRGRNKSSLAVYSLCVRIRFTTQRPCNGSRSDISHFRLITSDGSNVASHRCRILFPLRLHCPCLWVWCEVVGLRKSVLIIWLQLYHFATVWLL